MSSMPIKSWKTKWLLVALFPVMAGCQGTLQDRLGMSNRAPDEFQVIRRAPLVVPPDYNLVPPDEAATNAQQQQSRAARGIVTGRPTEISQGASASERALLSAVAVDTLPGIRTVLLQDAGSVLDIDESRFLAILDWQKPVFDGDQPLDAGQAADELQAAGAATRVITNRVSPAQGTVAQ